MTKQTLDVTCDWCGVEDRIPQDGGIPAKNNWVRLELYPLRGAEAGAVWDVCPYCWSVVQARKMSARIQKVV